MSRTNRIVSVAAAAMGGLLAGSAAFGAVQATSTFGGSAGISNLAVVDGVNGITGVKTVTLDDAATQPAKHDCKGMNDCKGQGGCKTGDNGCKGMNSCKGKGGCASTSADKTKEAPATQPSDSGSGM